MTFADLKIRLAEIRTAIAAIHKNGQSVNLNGSFSSTSADLDKLLAEEQAILHKIYRYHGYSRRSQPYYF